MFAATQQIASVAGLKATRVQSKSISKVVKTDIYPEFGTYLGGGESPIIPFGDEKDYIVETVLKSERVVARSNVKSIKARKDAESAEMNAVTARELLDEKSDASEQEISDLEAQIKAPHGARHS
ncbi:unnamed protein product [Bathycoccus prasinos]